MKKERVCQSAPKWLKEVATVYPSRIGLNGPMKNILAPLTGQDHAALLTFVHALDLYCFSDDHGRKHALVCMQQAVMSMQPSTQWIARATIPHLLDWDDRVTLWPQIIAAENPVPGMIVASANGVSA
jgi:hypothetical protein